MSEKTHLIRVHFDDGSSVKLSADAVSRLVAYHAQNVGEYFDHDTGHFYRGGAYPRRDFRVHAPRGMLDFIHILTEYFGG